MIKKFNVKKIRMLNIANRILSAVYSKPSAEELVNFNQVKNILIIDFSLIGDMIMNIPFLENIKKNCPKAKITMVCMPWAEVVLGDQNLIDNFIVFDGKNILSNPLHIIKHFKAIKRSLKEINKIKYDFGIEPKGDLRHILFLHYTNCRRTATYNYTGGEYLVTDCFQPLANVTHLIDEKNELLKMLGFKIEGYGCPELKLTMEWKEYADRFKEENDLIGYTLIGIHPGASCVNKQYPSYPELVSRIRGLNIKFLIFEGANEKEIVDKVCVALDEKEYVRIKKSLKEYISLVSLCDYMVCNDSAAGHIAAAYGISETVIFGPVLPENALPRGTGKIQFVSHKLNCKPCTLPTCPYGSNECIGEIKVNEILATLREANVL